MNLDPLHPVIEQIIDLHKARKTSVFIGLAGGVAAGKSTVALLLSDALTLRSMTTSVVSTDGFLLSNSQLASLGLSHRKGFPDSYDVTAIEKFFSAIRSGSTTTIPVYDHRTYDITDSFITVAPVDIVLLEGVNALQFAHNLDLGIYLHAEEPYLRKWFLARAFTYRDAARDTYSPFFTPWVDAPDKLFQEMAESAWVDVNLVNLLNYIEPTRAAAHLVIVQNGDHSIQSVERREPS